MVKPILSVGIASYDVKRRSQGMGYSEGVEERILILVRKLEEKGFENSIRKPMGGRGEEERAIGARKGI